MNADKLINIAMNCHGNKDNTVLRLIDLITTMSQAGNYRVDKENAAILYIIASNEKLYNEYKDIMDLGNNEINIEKVDNNYYSSSEKALLRLGVNLFNGYTGRTAEESCDYCINNIMNKLDERNRIIAMNAIKIRYADLKGN